MTLNEVMGLGFLTVAAIDGAAGIFFFNKNRVLTENSQPKDQRFTFLTLGLCGGSVIFLILSLAFFSGIISL